MNNKYVQFLFKSKKFVLDYLEYLGKLKKIINNLLSKFKTKF